MNVPVKEETITSTMKKLFWKAYFSIGLTHLPEYRRGSWERVKGSLRHLLKKKKVHWIKKQGGFVLKKRGLFGGWNVGKIFSAGLYASECFCVYMCMRKLRVCRADKGLSILSGYKETLLLAGNNRHLVATSATIIKTDNFSTHHKRAIASSSYNEIWLINLVSGHSLRHNEALFSFFEREREGMIIQEVVKAADWKGQRWQWFRGMWILRIVGFFMRILRRLPQRSHTSSRVSLNMRLLTHTSRRKHMVDFFSASGKVWC